MVPVVHRGERGFEAMPEQPEPEIMTAGSDERRSLRQRFRSLRQRYRSLLRYADGLGPWLRRNLGSPWRVGVAVAVAVALGVVAGGWTMAARADAAAQRRDAHTVSLAAFMRLAGDPGAESIEVVVVNAGTRPVTVTKTTPSQAAPVSSIEPVESEIALAPGSATTSRLRLDELDCAAQVPDQLSLRVDVRAADAQPQQLEIPVVGADEAFANLVMPYCQDLASRLTVRLAGDWRHRAAAGGPELSGMLEVVAKPPIGVQLLKVSGWAPFVMSSSATSNSTNSAPADVRGFRVTIGINSCSPAQPPDQGLLGLRAHVRTSDGRELDAPVQLSTEAAAALVGLYELVCGDAAGAGGLRVDEIPADGWWAESVGPEAVLTLHGTVEVTTTADQVTLTGVSESAGRLSIHPGWGAPPLRLSGPGRPHYVEIVVVLNCPPEALDAIPPLRFVLHGQAGGLPQTWPIPIGKSLRQAAEKACGAATSG